ncbi:MAG: GNAT family N-acetyltransferase [Leeuwenhoekiella sp.]
MKITFDTYKPEYSADFERLNIAWLKQYFYVEKHDEEVLSKPEKYIIQTGGHILVALADNQVVGVVALMKTEDGDYELTKMAVDKTVRGQKIGQQLMKYCLEYAKNEKIDSLILYSNRRLENAIYIYHKFGFVEVPLEDNLPYERADIKMKLTIK